MKPLLPHLLLLLTSLIFSVGAANAQPVEEPAPREPTVEFEGRTLPLVNKPLVVDDAGTLFVPGIRYQKIGPRNLGLSLYRPPFDTGVCPAIVVLHAGGFRNGGPMGLFPFAVKMAHAGYVVVTPVYRLSGEAPFPAAVHDAKAAVRWVRENAEAFMIDPDHIAVAGMSAGGVLAGFLGATNEMAEFEGPAAPDAPSSTIQASILMGAGINLAAPYLLERIEEAAKRTPPGGQRTASDLYLAWLGPDPETARQASPLTHLNEKMPPALFLDGSLDPPTGVRRYGPFLEKMKALGIPYEVDEIPDGPHVFATNDRFVDLTVEKVDAFLRKVWPDREGRQPGPATRALP